MTADAVTPEAVDGSGSDGSGSDRAGGGEGASASAGASAVVGDAAVAMAGDQNAGEGQGPLPGVAEAVAAMAAALGEAQPEAEGGSGATDTALAMAAGPEATDHAADQSAGAGQGTLPSVADAVATMAVGSEAAARAADLSVGAGEGMPPSATGATPPTMVGSGAAVPGTEPSAAASQGPLPSVADAVLSIADALTEAKPEPHGRSGAAEAVSEAVAEKGPPPSPLPPFMAPAAPAPPVAALPVYVETPPVPAQRPAPAAPPPDGLHLWRGVSRAGRATRIGLAAAVVIACAADLPGPRPAPVIDDQQTAVSTHERPHSGTGGSTSPSDRGKAGGEILPSAGIKAGEPDCSAQHPAGWLREENQIPGTTAWQDAKHTRAGSVNGYLNRVSVQCGDTVTAYLSSPVPVSGATLSAYRMGYYNGAGGRLVWQTKHLSVGPQAQATVTGSELLTEAPWKASLSFHITGQWTPGYYLLVVRAPGQTASSIPLVVRAEGDSAPLGFQASVLTYQAYNTFGGHSAYADAARKASASSEVSFDRPYEDGGYYSPYQYELPLIREMEKLGIDVDYFTDLDVDADPAQLKQHKGIVTGGHSEYWTKRMYDGAVAARQAGVNLAFFGANAVYTAARLTGSPAGPDRRVVIRRTTAGDSVAAADPSQATVNWAEAPLNRPEASLIGQGYGYLGANGSLRVLHPTSWIFANTGVSAGQVLRNTVGGEYDQVEPNKPSTPHAIDVLAAMPMRYANGHAGMATTTYYVATSQAGIFDAGTTYWPCVIAGDCLHLAPTPPESRLVIAQMTDNILTAFAAGPAGTTHPSTPNLPPSAEGLVSSAKEPGDVSLRAY